MNIFTPAIKNDEGAQKRVRQWARALRSGKYAQGNGYLRSKADVDEFCCLGVACDLLDPTGWSSNYEGTSFYQHSHGSNELLDSTGRLKLRLSKSGQQILTTLNDGRDEDWDTETGADIPAVPASDFKAIARRIDHDLKERLAS